MTHMQVYGRLDTCDSPLTRTQVTRDMKGTAAESSKGDVESGTRTGVTRSLVTSPPREEKKIYPLLHYFKFPREKKKSEDIVNVSFFLFFLSHSSVRM